jgi:hypothetical protein
VTEPLENIHRHAAFRANSKRKRPLALFRLLVPKATLISVKLINVALNKRIGVFSRVPASDFEITEVVPKLQFWNRLNFFVFSKIWRVSRNRLFDSLNRPVCALPPFGGSGALFTHGLAGLQTSGLLIRSAKPS